MSNTVFSPCIVGERYVNNLTGFYWSIFSLLLLNSRLLFKLVGSTWRKAVWWTFIAVFPTHRLYLGGPPKYIWWHISVFITIIILLHFFYPPELMKPSAIDKLVENLALCVSYGSFCVLENTPTDNLQCFPYVHLFVPSRLNIHPPLPLAPTSQAWL